MYVSTQRIFMLYRYLFAQQRFLHKQKSKQKQKDFHYLIINPYKYYAITKHPEHTQYLNLPCILVRD